MPGQVGAIGNEREGLLAYLAQMRYADNFALGDGETIEDVFARYDRIAARTEETVAGIADLSQDVPAAAG